MSASILDKIREIAQPIIDRQNAFIVDVVIRGERSSKVIEVYVDTDTGILLEQCSAISRELSAQLDEADLIQGRYRLDVSSPGLDKPLKLVRQYKKNIGRNCKIVTSEEGEKIFVEGVLEQADEHSVTINQKGKQLEIEFSKIVEAFIIPKFK